MVFGGGAFGRGLNLDGVVKWGPHEGISTLVRRDTRELALSLPCEDTAKANICKLEREPLPEPKHADALILDFQPPELWENKILLFKSPSLHFVVGDHAG